MTDASYTHVRTACQWLHGVLSSYISEEKLYEIELAASEVLTNIVKHACDGENPACRIHVTVHIYANKARIFFIDDGKRMPAAHVESINAPEKMTSLPDDLEEGGRGIFLIKTCTDKVRYRRLGANNILLLMVGTEK